MSDNAVETISRMAGLTVGSSAQQALGLRRNVLDMTAGAEEATLRPGMPGGLSHALRAALATRTARICGHEGLAEYYKRMIGDQEVFPLSDPSESGNSPQIATILAFADKVTMSPRDITAEDIETLKDAGVSDADIVRICELMAFLAFQYRVIAGLALMGEQV